MDIKEQEELINEIYKTYPRKEGKAAGVIKLRKHIISNPALAGEIYLAVQNYNEVIKHRKLEPKYIMMFSTFVNGRWQDYIDITEFVPTKSSLSFS